MKTASSKHLLGVLERNGWNLLRIRGGHHIYGKSGSIVRLSVSIHGNRPLTRGLLKHLSLAAGLSEKDLKNDCLRLMD
jgi:predicted RNA binding protein YcfA (HicA-like mRNA interferase family)